MRCLNGVLSVIFQISLNRSLQRGTGIVSFWIETRISTIKGAYHMDESTPSPDSLSVSNIGATRHAHSVTPSTSPNYSRPCGAFPQARSESSCRFSCPLASTRPEGAYCTNRCAILCHGGLRDGEL